MHQTVTAIEYLSSYKDLKNNIRQVKHSIVQNFNNSNKLEERIVDELYRVFTHKAS